VEVGAAAVVGEVGEAVAATVLVAMAIGTETTRQSMAIGATTLARTGRHPRFLE